MIPKRAPERWVVIDQPAEPLSDLEGALLFVALLPLLPVLVPFIVGDGQPGKRRQYVKKIAGAAVVALTLAGLVDIAGAETVLVIIMTVIAVLGAVFYTFIILGGVYATVFILFFPKSAGRNRGYDAQKTNLFFPKSAGRNRGYDVIGDDDDDGFRNATADVYAAAADKVGALPAKRVAVQYIFAALAGILALVLMFGVWGLSAPAMLAWAMLPLTLTILLLPTT